MNTKNIKLIAFIGQADYVQTAYAELKSQPNVKLIRRSCFHYYRRLCMLLHIKAFDLIYSLLSLLFLAAHCSRKKNNVILFHGVSHLWLLDLPLISLAKKRYNAKTVGLFWDSIDFEKYKVYEYKDKLDMIIQADPFLVNKYGLDYYPIAFYSRLNIKPSSDSCDVFYCGEDGGRLPIMEKVFERLSGMGLKCDFYCARSDKEGRIINGIKHISKMTYREYLSHMLSARIILDILKPGIQGPTLRCCEAVVYDKKVLTNNPIAKEMSVYDENQFCIFDEKYQFDERFLSTELSSPNTHKADLSPMRMIEFISSKLNLE